eukprot:3384880-Pleurochrysis_carterae.AAC.1
MAFINYGDAAFSNHIVRTKGPRETLAVCSSVRQSMPSGSAPTCAKTMWLGDTGAGMHCVTDIALA